MNNDNSRLPNTNTEHKQVLVVDDDLLSRVRSHRDERAAEVIVSQPGASAVRIGEPAESRRPERTREFRRRVCERAANIARIRRENERAARRGRPVPPAPPRETPRDYDNERIFENDINEALPSVAAAAESYSRESGGSGSYSFTETPKPSTGIQPQSFERHRRDEGSGTGGVSGGYRHRYRWATGIAVCVAAAVLILVPLLLLGTTNTKAVSLADYQPSPSPAAAEEAPVIELNTAAAQKGAQEAAMMLAAQEALPTPSPTPEPIEISVGYTGPEVSQIQLHLMDLGYMMGDEPTEYYGLLTQESVAKFQDKNGLTPNGTVDNETYDLLLSGNGVYYSISLGAESTDVYELQIRLRELGYLDKATSYFGEETQAAVVKFQQKNDIDADGAIGEATREKLYSEDVVANALSYGDNSDEIKTYQTRLKKLGYLTTTPDGQFGNDTVMAVKRFQERNGLIADGHIGPSTKTLLMGDDAVSNSLQIGDKGDDVTKVQKRLVELKYLSGEPDGYFGEKTDGAVRSFQKLNSLSSDGKVGSRTMNTLMSSDAKKYSATTAKPVTKPTTGGNTGGNTGGTTTVPETSGANVASLIAMAESRMGCPYVLGAKGPNTFDCSGFVYWCLNQIGVNQGYMTSYTWRSVTKYTRIESMSQIQAGDIIVYHSNGLSSTKGHVGIALSSSQMIDASSNKEQVRKTSIQSSYWQEHFVCAYRIF